MSGIYSWSRVIAKVIENNDRNFNYAILNGTTAERNSAVAVAFPCLVAPTDWDEFDRDFKVQLQGALDGSKYAGLSFEKVLLEICGGHHCRKWTRDVCDGFAREHGSEFIGALLAVIGANYSGGQQKIAAALSEVRREINQLIDHANNGCDCSDQ